MHCYVGFVGPSARQPVTTEASSFADDHSSTRGNAPASRTSVPVVTTGEVNLLIWNINRIQKQQQQQLVTSSPYHQQTRPICQLFFHFGNIVESPFPLILITLATNAHAKYFISVSCSIWTKAVFGFSSSASSAPGCGWSAASSIIEPTVLWHHTRSVVLIFIFGIVLYVTQLLCVL